MHVEDPDGNVLRMASDSKNERPLETYKSAAADLLSCVGARGSTRAVCARAVWAVQTRTSQSTRKRRSGMDKIIDVFSNIGQPLRLNEPFLTSKSLGIEAPVAGQGECRGQVSLVGLSLHHRRT